MLAALLLAASTCAGWHADVVGSYLGEVESRGPKAIDTVITETATGLAGTYVLHEETRDVTGTLEPLGDAGCEVALFKWTDIYGTGVARLRFHPAQRCFEGSWGLEEPRADLPWRSCVRTRMTS